jgi:hypothetical protein
MSQAALECEIQRGIERGWQVPRGENEAGTTAIAVPTGRRQAARCGTQAARPAGLDWLSINNPSADSVGCCRAGAGRCPRHWKAIRARSCLLW